MEETNDKQDKTISEIPALTAVAASMARSVSELAADQKAFMKKVDKYIEPLKAAQSDEAVRTIYNQLAIERLVKWKDSIREVIESE